MPNYEKRPVSDIPGFGEEELIGVELTFIDDYGRQTELEMLVPRRRLTFATPRTNPTTRPNMKVTLHMTNGDRTMQIPL